MFLFTKIFRPVGIFTTGKYFFPRGNLAHDTSMKMSIYDAHTVHFSLRLCIFKKIVSMAYTLFKFIFINLVVQTITHLVIFIYFRQSSVHIKHIIAL
jgi:hypothetical protein